MESKAHPPDTCVLSSLKQLRALSHPLRQRMLGSFARKSSTPMQVAAELGENAGRLYHHVAILAAAGLIRLVETRPKRGTTEHYYEAVAARFAVAAGLLDARRTKKSPVESLFERAFDAALSEIRSAPARDAASGPHVLVHGRVGGTPRQMARLRARLEALLREYQGPAQPGQPTTGFLAALYPLPPRRGKAAHR